MESEHPAKSDRHIRVTGKIVVDLQGIEQCTKPCPTHCKLGKIAVKEIARELARNVCNQDLFGQTEYKPGHAL